MRVNDGTIPHLACYLPRFVASNATSSTFAFVPGIVGNPCKRSLCFVGAATVFPDCDGLLARKAFGAALADSQRAPGSVPRLLGYFLDIMAPMDKQL